MEKIIMYSTGCPKCKVLEAKLNKTEASYTICTDTKIMTEKGINHLPALEYNGKIYGFSDAVKLINGGEFN